MQCSIRRTRRPCCFPSGGSTVRCGSSPSARLLDAAGGENGAVAIGIGVNCASHPASTDYPATDLAAAGVAISPAMLFGPLSLKMIGRLAQWNGGEGIATV